MFQPIITEDQTNWYKFDSYINVNKILFTKHPDSKYTFEYVKKWIEDYPDLIRSRIEKSFHDFFKESEKTSIITGWVEPYICNVLRHFNPDTIWRLYSLDLYLAFRKFIGERTLKKKEKTIDCIEIDNNTFVVTIYITNMFRNMDRALTFFTNKGALSVEFKIIYP